MMKKIFLLLALFVFSKLVLAQGDGMFNTLYVKDKALMPKCLSIGSSSPAETTFLKLAAGTTVSSQINFINGVAPTSPTQGDFWSTGTTLNFYDGTSTIDLLSGGASLLNDLTDVNQDFVSASGTIADEGKIPYYDFTTKKFVTHDAVTQGTLPIKGKTSIATSSIAKGLPVYVDGFDSDLQVVELADADGTGTYPCIGFTAESLNSSDSKHIITFGKLTGVNTTTTVTTLNPNGETWLQGDDLYLSTTAGGVTKVRPTGTAQIQRIAQVLKANDATGGQLFIFNTARTAGLPNLAQDNVWVGDANGYPVEADKSTLADGNGIYTGTGDNLANNHLIDLNGFTLGIEGGSLTLNTDAPLEGYFLNNSLNNNIFRVRENNTTNDASIQMLSGDGANVLVSLNNATDFFNTGKNFGIRTNNPLANLHLTASAHNNGFSLYQVNGTTLAAKLNHVVNATSMASSFTMYEDNGTTAGIQLGGASASYSFINDGNSFGIGTTTPSAKLHVNGTTQLDGALTNNAAGSNSKFTTTGNANTLVIEGSSGFVGIHTSNPAHKLHLDVGTTDDGFFVTSGATTRGRIQTVSAGTEVSMNLFGSSSKNIQFHSSQDSYINTGQGFSLGSTSTTFQFETSLNAKIGTELGVGADPASNAFLRIAASTTAKAQFRLEAGVAPSTLSNGQLWYDGTSLNMRSGGVTTDLLAGGGTTLYTGSGALSGATTVTMDGNTLTLSGGALSMTSNITTVPKLLIEGNTTADKMVHVGNDNVGTGAGTATGLYVDAHPAAGTGVYHGIWSEAFQSVPTHNYGIQGRAANGSTLSVGLYGAVTNNTSTISSAYTAGVLGTNSADVGATHYAGYFTNTSTSASATMYGVYGSAISSISNQTRYGGFFTASGAGAGAVNYGLVVDDGNSGFGTLTPQERVHVNGNTQVDGYLSTRGAAVTHLLATVNTFRGASNTDSRGIAAFTNLAGDIAFSIGTGVGSNGSVGIGRNAISGSALGVKADGAASASSMFFMYEQGGSLAFRHQQYTGGLSKFGFGVNSALGLNAGASNYDASGIINIDGSTTGASQIYLRNGADPTGGALVSGALWRNGTALNFYDGTSTINLAAGGGTTLYTGSGELSGATTVTMGSNDLTFSGAGASIFSRTFNTTGGAVEATAISTIGSTGFTSAGKFTSTTTTSGFSANNVGIEATAVGGTSETFGVKAQINSGAINTPSFGTYGVFSRNQSSTNTANYAGWFQSNGTGNTKYGAWMQATGAGNNNYAIKATATGATNNYALVTNGGNVGIGTLTPSSLLHVNGATQFDGNSTVNGTLSIGNGSILNTASGLTDITIGATGLIDDGIWLGEATPAANNVSIANNGGVLELRASSTTIDFYSGTATLLGRFAPLATNTANLTLQGGLSNNKLDLGDKRVLGALAGNQLFVGADNLVGEVIFGGYSGSVVTPKMELNTNTGNLGLGIFGGSIGAKLHVNGTTKLDGAVTINDNILTQTDASILSTFRATSSTGLVNINFDNNNFATNPVGQILAGGQTYNGGSPLTLLTNSFAIRSYNADRFVLATSAADPIYFCHGNLNNAGTYLKSTSTGILLGDGIGASSASARLDVIGTTKLTGRVTQDGLFVGSNDLIPDNDAVPTVNTSNVYTYNGTANSVVVVDLTTPVAGSFITIIGNSDTFTISINDGGNFNLASNWVGGADDAITLFVVADNNYIEISRSNN